LHGCVSFERYSLDEKVKSCESSSEKKSLLIKLRLIFDSVYAGGKSVN
jgi:hypothetical protein